MENSYKVLICLYEIHFSFFHINFAINIQEDFYFNVSFSLKAGAKILHGTSLVQAFLKNNLINFSVIPF